MDVLLVGSGGREHAIAWKLKQSKKLDKLYIAPGNAGTTQLGENVAIKDTDIQGLVDFAKQKKVGLVVVGPEDPLSMGLGAMGAWLGGGAGWALFGLDAGAGLYSIWPM